MESRVGLIIGHHYASGSVPAIMSMVTTECCGLQASDFGKFFSKGLHNSGLPLTTTVSGYATGLRTAGVAAHVTTGMFKNIMCFNRA